MELPNDIEGLRRMLLKVLDDLQAVKAENAFLKAENAELRSRLGMNSSNSHKPPSSDGYKKIKKFSALRLDDAKPRAVKQGT